MPHTASHPPAPSDLTPIYPELEVCVRSLHPLVLVSNVRWALWRAGVDHEQISRFSRQALTAESEQRQRQVCGRWVTVCP